ncbi:MAG: amidohydrolase, partial [Deltaproteobacteria bacterium]|nr:amidohydrolase [Deltaproteobacteria bacterium]
QEENAQRYNDWLLEECSKYPGRLYPLLAIDPRAPFAEKMARSFLEAGGFGLGELCVYETGLDPLVLLQLERLAALCRAHEAPLLVHVNESLGHPYLGKAPIQLTEIWELILRTQGTKLILAHFGGGIPFFASLKKGMRELLNLVRFDTAAMPFIYDPVALSAALTILGPEFFLFGTDFPLLSTPRYLKFFKQANLTEPQQALILGENARTFLEFHD